MWDAFKSGIFAVIQWFYGFAGDWGLAIILITVLFRILIYPITRKQFQSSYKMQKLQPKINEIRAKYGDDQKLMQEEMQRIYQEAKFNPLSGCLPMILQMPIFMALYGVLRGLEDYIKASEGAEASLPITFYHIIPDLSFSPNQAFATGFGFSLIYILLVVLFAGSMLAPLLINKTTERNQLIMTGVMSLFMLYIGWNAPAGVLLYWVVSSFIGVGQQLVSKKLLGRKDAIAEAEAVEVKPVRVNVVRKEKKARPKKSK